MRIKEIREQKGIKQKELAAAIGIAANTLSQYENEKREPDLVTIKKMAAALDVSIDALLGVKQEEKPADDAISGLSEYERKFIEWFRSSRATEKDKALVRMIVEGEK